jgi:putative transposase
MRLLYLDAIHFKVRYEGRYETRAFYTVYAVDWDGQRDLLGYVYPGSGRSGSLGASVGRP